MDHLPHGTQVAGGFRLSGEYRQLLEGIRAAPRIAARIQPPHPGARELGGGDADRPLLLPGLPHALWAPVPALRAGYSEDVPQHPRRVSNALRCGGKRNPDRVAAHAVDLSAAST